MWTCWLQISTGSLITFCSESCLECCKPMGPCKYEVCDGPQLADSAHSLHRDTGYTGDSHASNDWIIKRFSCIPRLLVLPQRARHSSWGLLHRSLSMGGKKASHALHTECEGISFNECIKTNLAHQQFLSALKHYNGDIEQFSALYWSRSTG